MKISLEMRLSDGGPNNAAIITEEETSDSKEDGRKDGQSFTHDGQLLRACVVKR